nr:exopolysaccharide Pel transporter PelG [Fusobacterium sp. oral taxon 203]
MAGIGFELKKLFSEEEELPFANLRAIIFSIIVSVGPWLITATSLNIIIWISNQIELARPKQLIFMSSIFYCFIFSQILTCIFQYIITRYVSDCVFKKKISKIRGAYLGSIKLIAILAFFVSFIFIKNGDLSTPYKASFVFLFVFMSLSWISMIFISLLKKYHFLIFSFFFGNFISMALGFYFLKYPVTFFEEEPIFWMLLSYGIGIFINFILTSSYILRAFKGKSENDFEFLTYLKGYFSLALIGFFYSVGVWGHVFMNWIVGDSYRIAGVFQVSPLYEVAIFYCYCISIPSIVYFAIFLETKFLPVYKEYYKKICKTGTYSEIENSLKKMKQTLYQEILYGMELQFLISLTCVLLANAVFTYFDMDIYLLDLFRVSVFSTYCATFVSILITLYLYFDLRIHGICISFFLLFSNFFFTYIFGRLGKQYTGVGFFIY